jgi:hypothetical protein
MDGRSFKDAGSIKPDTGCINDELSKTSGYVYVYNIIRKKYMACNEIKFAGVSKDGNGKIRNH